VIEKKWSTDGEQQFYRPDSCIDLPEWIPRKGIELIGVSEKSINVTYGKYPGKGILETFNVTTKHAFCDYYAIEVFDDYEILKIYDQDLSKYPLPSLPPGSRLDPLKSGIGVYYPDAIMAKIYFLHNDVNVVHEWFKDLNPVKAPSVTKLTYFGLEYNLKTLELTNISQYDIFNDEDHLNE
jgi:hypothetical protein